MLSHIFSEYSTELLFKELSKTVLLQPRVTFSEHEAPLHSNRGNVIICLIWHIKIWTKIEGVLEHKLDHKPLKHYIAMLWKKGLCKWKDQNIILRAPQTINFIHLRIIEENENVSYNYKVQREWMERELFSEKYWLLKTLYTSIVG